MDGDILMSEEIINAIVEYICKSPIWLLSLICMYLQGVLLHIIILGYSKRLKKYNKRFYMIALGASCTCISFFIRNAKYIISSKLTLQIIEEEVLASVFCSFAFIGIIAVIVLPIREIVKLKGKK